MIQSFASGAVTVELFEQHAVLTLNQPGRKNALSRAMWRALPEAIDHASLGSAKVVVIAGAGEAFSAGADISEFEQVWANAASAQAYAGEIAAGMTALAGLAKPTIAAISGPCIGGGMGLALACDIRLAATTSKFGITPGKLGLVYSLEDTKRLLDLIGPAATKDILFTGRILNAEEALALRLVNGVVSPDALEGAVLTKVAEIAAASQWSARGTKTIVDLILNGQTQDDERTRALFLDATQGPDFREGRAAFLEKRKPNFPFL